MSNELGSCVGSTLERVKFEAPVPAEEETTLRFEVVFSPRP